jgi:RNA polymerase sigma-70 factor (ECF subfamily)
VRRVLEVSREEHHRLLHAFVQAFGTGKLDRIMALMAEDATLIVDTGSDGHNAGCTHDIGRPVCGAEQIAAFLAGIAREGTRLGTLHICTLNGQRALVFMRDRRPRAAVLIGVADGRIRHIFVQTDASRLRCVAPLE